MALLEILRKNGLRGLVRGKADLAEAGEEVGVLVHVEGIEDKGRLLRLLGGIGMGDQLLPVDGHIGHLVAGDGDLNIIYETKQIQHEKTNYVIQISNSVDRDDMQNIFKFISPKMMVTGFLPLLLISFLASFLLATVILRVVAFALDLFANLPVIRGVNKLAGAALGAIEGIALVWLIMAILTVLCNTQVGKTALEMIRKDTFLDYMYGQNLFLKFFTEVL